LLGTFATLALRAAEELRELGVAFPLGVLDVGLETEHVAKAGFDEPDDVVVLVRRAGD
jgi:hypothetical protein